MPPPRGQEQRLIEEVRRLRNELGRARRGHPRGPLLVAAGGVLLAPLLLAVSLVRGRGARRKALEEAARALEQATQMREEAVALQAEIMGIVARTQEAVQAKVEREAAVYLREQEMRVGRRVEEIEERADERAKQSAARTKQVLEAEAAEQKRELQTAFAAESKRLQREVFDLWEKAERIAEKSQRAERAAAEAAEQLRGLGSAAQPAVQAKKLADEAGVLNRQCLDELDAFNNARVRMDVAQLDPDDVKARLLALKIHSSAVRTVENLLRAGAETAAAEAAGGPKKGDKVVAVLRVRRSGGGAGQAPTASPRQLIRIEEGAVLTVAEPDPRRRTRQPYSRGAVEGGGQEVTALRRRRFAFDEVLDSSQPSSSAEGLYERHVARITDAFLSGWNGTVLASGPSGSGKTHTLKAAGGGVMGLALDHIFKEHDRRPRTSSAATIAVSRVGVRGDDVYDLLQGRVPKRLKLGASKNGPARGVRLRGLIRQPAGSAAEAMRLLSAPPGTTQPAARKTPPRGLHELCTVYYLDGEVSTKLHFVDLASGPEGGIERQRSKLSVDPAIATLRKVVRALSEKRSHVPFREATLTRLLANSLGGNSLSLVIDHLDRSVPVADDGFKHLEMAAQSRRIENKTFRARPPAGGAPDGPSACAVLEALVHSADTGAQVASLFRTSESARNGRTDTLTLSQLRALLDCFLPGKPGEVGELVERLGAELGKDWLSMVEFTGSLRRCRWARAAPTAAGNGVLSA